MEWTWNWQYQNYGYTVLFQEYCTAQRPWWLVLSKTTVRELERIQNMVGRFILQVPSATSRSLAWMDAGLMPMQDCIMIRQANYIWTAICKRSNPMIQSVLKFQLEWPTDPNTKAWMSIQKKVGIVTNFPTSQSLNQALTNVAVEYVLQVKAEHTTMRVVPQPEKWFALQDHVNDSAASRALCCVRGGNTLLGNRFMARCMSVAHTVKLSMVREWPWESLTWYFAVPLSHDNEEA